MPSSPPASIEPDPLRGVPLEALRSFEAAARHLSFTRAAQELCLTQSAVSRAVQTLESRLGQRLFEREHQGLRLTSAGERLGTEVRDSLAALRGALRRAARIPERRSLTVRMPRSLGMKWLMPRLVEFGRDHPEIELHFSIAPRPGGPEDRACSNERFVAACDVGIRNALRSEAEGCLHRLGAEMMFPCCAPALAAGLDPPIAGLADLARLTLIEFDDGLPALDGNWAVWERLTQRPGLGARTWLRVPDWNTVYNYAIQGRGVSVGRTPHVNDELCSGMLIAPWREVLVSTRAHYLVPSAADRSDPQVQAVVDWLVAEFDAEARFEAEWLQGRLLFDLTTARPGCLAGPG